MGLGLPAGPRQSSWPGLKTTFTPQEMEWPVSYLRSVTENKTFPPFKKKKNKLQENAFQKRFWARAPPPPRVPAAGFTQPCAGLGPSRASGSDAHRYLLQPHPCPVTCWEATGLKAYTGPSGTRTTTQSVLFI